MSDAAVSAAREQSLALFRHELGDAEGDALALALAKELLAGLQQEHEDDLVRARERSFDLGVRSALQALTGDRRITATQRDEYAARFAAAPALDFAVLHDRLVPVLGAGNDDAAAIEQADLVVSILRALLP